MKIKLAPLLNRLASYENESLSSLCYRVGMINHAGNSWLLDVIYPDKKKKVWGNWINRISDPATINKISELTLLTSEEIIRMTTHSFAKIISPGKQKLCLENIKPPLRSTGKYCSRCISEQPAEQIQWELPYVTACLKHHLVLIDTCPACGLRSQGLFVMRGYCSCGYRLDGGLGHSSLSGDEARYQEIIYDKLGLGEGGTTPELDKNPAFSLLPPDFFTLLDAMASNIKYIPRFNEEELPSPNLYNHTLYCEAARTLNNWPYNFFEFLRIYSQSPKVKHLKTGLERDFAPLLRAVKRRLVDQKFEFLKTAIEEYLVREWDGGVLTTNMARFTKIAGQAYKQRYVTLTQAMKELRIRKDSLTDIVKAGKLPAIVNLAGANYTHYLIDKKAVDEFGSKRRALLDDKQAAEFMGIGRRMVAKLARAGVLQPARGKTVDGYPVWLFEEQYIHGFVSKYQNFGTLDHSSLLDNLLSFHDAIKYLSFYRVDVPEMIRLVDEGHLNPDVDLTKTGLAAMMFKRSDLEKYIEEKKERHRKDVGMTIQEAAKSLGVKNVVVKRWVDRGLLQASRGIESGRAKVHVPEANICEFKAKYIFTEEAARRLGVTPRTVLDWSRHGKIKAYCGPRIDGGGRLLFRADEIQSFIQSRSGCKPGLPVPPFQS